MLQLGIIGAGRMGRVHIQGIVSGVPGARIRSIRRPHLHPEVRELARKAGAQVLTEDYCEVLRDPKIDAVLICSPTDTHAAISLEALEAGKHVFCEKPVDLSLVKIQTVIDAASRSELKYQVGFNRVLTTIFRPFTGPCGTGRWARCRWSRSAPGTRNLPPQNSCVHPADCFWI